MVGLANCVGFVGAPSWKHKSGDVASFATARTTTRVRPACLPSAGSSVRTSLDFHCGTAAWTETLSLKSMLCRPLVEVGISFALHLHVIRMWQTRPCSQHTALDNLIKMTRQHLSSNNGFTPRWMGSQLVRRLDVQLQGGLEAAERYLPVGSSTPVDDFQGSQLDKELDILWHMDQHGYIPSIGTYSSLLKACANRKALVAVKRVHEHLAKHGLHSSSKFLGEYLVITFVKCGSLEDALQVFHRLPHRTVFSWTAVISGYTTAGQGQEALRMYHCMLEQGLEPDKYTFVILLKACASLSDLENGKCIHAEALRYRCASDLFVATGLLDMYAKCGSILDAQRIFDDLSGRDVVSWNAMIAAYAQDGQADKALQIYEQMCEEGVTPNSQTFLGTLQACGVLAGKEVEVVVNGRLTKGKSLQQGKTIHADVWRKGYDSDVFIGSTLVSMYGKCGSILDAQNVFDGLSQRNVVSWNAIVAAHAQYGQAEKALLLLTQMRQEGVSPDDITILSILQACGDTGGLDVCRQVHQAVALAGNGNVSTPLGNTLIHAYGRCASMVEAQAVFDALPGRNVVSWSALIAGYAREGSCSKSLQCYEEMLLARLKPNGVTYLSLLSACSRAGLVDKGVEFFESMTRDHGITPGIEHYAVIVDLLGRVGYFAIIESLLLSMPMQPDLPIWLCLLGACRKHANVVLAQQAFDSAVSLSPKHAAAYVLMSNIYADAGLPEQAREVYDQSLQLGAWKTPGQSWIKHGQEVEIFAVGDHKHAQQEQLYDLIRQLPDIGAGSCCNPDIFMSGRIVQTKGSP